MDKFVGKRLDGRYEIRELIGVGGMATVYKAYDNVENRTVAVKILKEEFSSNEEFLRRFKNESKAIAVLSHPNIVKVYDVSFGDLLQYIVMEYIDGVTLKEFIDQQGALRWKDAVHFTVQILRALQHAHDKGIVHRDVKPQNIMLLPDGKIKVTDFGIARFARSEHETLTNKTIGSVHYISPEQARGDETDEKSDIYSVGIILYEMLTGQLPFEADTAVSVAIMQLQSTPKNPREINPEIPVGLEQITLKAMEKDSLKRYQTAAEMLCDLEEFRRDPSIRFDRNIFVEDKPAEAADEDGADGGEEQVAPRPPLIPILVGIAIALLLVLGVLGALFIPRLFGKSSDSFPCPDLVGVKYNDLATGEEYKGLNFKVIQQYSDKQEAGYIIEQDPKPGRSIKESTTITVTVSMGPKRITLPDVYEQTEAQARTILESKHFVVGQIVEIPDENIAAGLIVRTEPARGESVPEGAKITLYISTGKEVIMQDLPNWVNQTLDSDVREEVAKKGFVVGEVTRVNSYAPEGTIVKQTPAGGSGKQAPRGSEIAFQVSNGVPPEFEFTVQFNDGYLGEHYGKTGKVEIEFYRNGKALKDNVDISENDVLLSGSRDFSAKLPKYSNITAEVYVTVGGKRHLYATITIDVERGRVTHTSYTNIADEK